MEREKKMAEQAKKRALSSSIIRELKEQYSDAPEEIREGHHAHTARQNREDEHRLVRKEGRVRPGAKEGEGEFPSFLFFLSSFLFLSFSLFFPFLPSFFHSFCLSSLPHSSFRGLDLKQSLLVICKWILKHRMLGTEQFSFMFL